MSDTKATAPQGEAQHAGTSSIEWDDSNMETTYANVANAASTREEVAFIFGTNKTWQNKADQAIKIDINNRIILSPFAAKRFALLLNKVLQEYESRFGELDVERAQQGAGR